MPTAAHPPVVHAVVMIICRQKSARERLLSAAVSAGSSRFAFNMSENTSGIPETAAAGAPSKVVAKCATVVRRQRCQGGASDGDLRDRAKE